VVIAAEDLKEHTRDVKEAGGKVLGEPMEIPGVGQYVSFMDTEGNRVSMLHLLAHNCFCCEDILCKKVNPGQRLSI
jgi:uncharacterized protein